MEGALYDSAPRKWRIAAKRSKVKTIEDDALHGLTERIEHTKASIRAAVEQPFRVIKRQFGHLKTRCRGLAKIGAQVLTLFTLSNLWMTRRPLLGTRPKGASWRRNATKPGEKSHPVAPMRSTNAKR